MLNIFVSRKLSKELKLLEIKNSSLFKETLEKIEEFQNYDNHKRMSVHKLHGKKKDFYSFSINYKYRILFQYNDKNTITLLTFGDHSIYN